MCEGVQGYGNGVCKGMGRCARVCEGVLGYGKGVCKGMGRCARVCEEAHIRGLGGRRGTLVSHASEATPALRSVCLI